MRTVKRVLLGIAALISLGVVGVLTNFYLLSPKRRPPQQLSAELSPVAVERGRYLADHVAGCTGCHSPADEHAPGEPPVANRIGAGRDFGEDPAQFPGHIRASNLTPDPETGLGRWTDGEIVRAMREGIARDGRNLFPMMPYRVYAETLSDGDALAIVAYLRSLPPIRSSMSATTVDFPISMFIRTYPRPTEHQVPPPPRDPLTRGNWLLRLANCVDCHTTVDDAHEPLPGHFLAGGNPFPVPGGATRYSANITSDAATGIGAYTDAEILRAITEGVGKAGQRLAGMPWVHYAGMTDEDKTALLAALRAVPPVKHLVRQPEKNL